MTPDKLPEAKFSHTPFRHWIIDYENTSRFLPASWSFPAPDWPHWLHYKGVNEQKRTCEDLSKIPEACARILQYLQDDWMLNNLRDLTGIEDLQPDPTLRGAGLHQFVAGDFLDIHLDYDIHPTLHLQRRLNALFFLSPIWEDSWGGSLELWDRDARRKVTEIFPKHARLVLFECSDHSYHGMPKPLVCPAGIPRNTIAAYYLAPPPGRRRALFVPRRECVHEWELIQTEVGSGERCLKCGAVNAY